jgi:hypothetical protein
LRRVISPGAEVQRRAATIRTGEEIRLAGKCSERHSTQACSKAVL